MRAARLYRLHERKIDVISSVVLGLLAWEIVDYTLVRNPLVLVGPSQISIAFFNLLSKGELLHHIYVTFVEFILGYLVGVVVGLGFGTLMGLSRTAQQLLKPWVIISYNAPVILLAPLFIIALGIGIVSKIGIVFIGAVFPVLFNTYAGITTTDGRLVEAVRAFGGTRVQEFFMVTVPSALPLIMTGLRLSVGRAIVGAIISEFFGSKAGIGYMISAASEEFETAQAFVGVILLALWGYLTFEILKYTERRIAPWHEFKV
jgi:ABC-type nitrate/sulfonate/bicarbonate transport system permease component